MNVEFLSIALLDEQISHSAIQLEIVEVQGSESYEALDIDFKWEVTKVLENQIQI